MKQDMTPKEKAKHLVKRSMPLAHDWESDNEIVAVKIALLCVDVILNEVGAKGWEVDTATKTNYWQDVETELSLL